MDIAALAGARVFLVVIVTGIVVMALSRLLDLIWANVLRLPWLYLVFAAPGIVIHECAHVLGCLFTGAQITKIVLLSRDGGSVSYTKPKIPVLGNVIISTAPLFCLPLVLAGLTWIFSTYAHCWFVSTIPVTDSVGALVQLLTNAGLVLYYNLVLSFNAWFLLYLYLVTSLVLSVAPSTQDLKNAAAGLALIVLVIILLLLSGIPPVTGSILYLVRLLGAGFAVGLAFELVTLMVTAPFLVFYRKQG